MADLLLFISRVLSYSVIAISTCMKLPQAWKIYSAGGTKGISIRGYWLEIASYSVGASYGFFNDIHYSNYLELIILATQSFTIIMLSIRFSRKLNIENILCFIVLLAFIGMSVTKTIPGFILDGFILLGIPLASSSKLLQVNALYQRKSSGDVSLVTWALATYGCGARLFTTVVEVSSFTVLLSYFVSFTLNSVIVMEIVYYGRGKKKPL